MPAAHCARSAEKVDLRRLRHLYPFTSRYFNRRGMCYHYLDEGRGSPVVMLHGNPSWSFYYRRLVGALSPHRRCIVPDHFGCGLSETPPPQRYGYRLKDRVDDLDALLSHLGMVAPVDLVVHDWGGMIGAVWALRRPERVNRLVIMNTAAFLPPGGKPVPWQLRWIRGSRFLAPTAVLGGNLFARGAAHMASHKGLPAGVRKGLTAPYNNWHNRLATLKFVQDIPITPNDPSYRLVAETDAALHRLSHCPMLICWGKHDFVFDTDYLAEWQRRFPHARAHLFEDAGHYVLEDAPDRVAAAICDFLNPSNHDQ